MSAYPIRHCPDVELTKLPHDDVHTHDGHRLALGSVTYFRFTPTPEATEYVVISDRAIRCKGGHRVLVVGPRGIPMAIDPYDLVHEPNEWWEFWKKRYSTPANGSQSTNGKRTIASGSRARKRRRNP